MNVGGTVVAAAAAAVVAVKNAAEVVKALLAAPSSFTSPSKKGSSSSSSKGSSSTTTGARVSSFTSLGHHSPLHYAAGAGELPALKLLDKAATAEAKQFKVSECTWRVK